ncbi:MAG: 3-hydroxy-3-methylglutaryl-CoA reductase [Candidatus Micrarchaeota archaeon]|nr:3-hydroxy-3-methylglutaryl-CoA reductase [Candidatus Micrarchaeota archaeon]
MEEPTTVRSSSRFHNFSRLNTGEQARVVAEFARLDESDRRTLQRLIERRDSPQMQIAPNFTINGKDYFVPMVTEEASVVPAASNGARLVAKSGGFTAGYTGSEMMGNIQITDVKDPMAVAVKLLAYKNLILVHANEASRHIVADDFAVEAVPRDGPGNMIAVNFTFHTADSMGANKINEMLERVGPMIRNVIGDNGRVNAGIMSNSSKNRLVMVGAKVLAEDLGGEEVAEKIARLSEFGSLYPDRAVTENKGIMNGVIGVLTAMDNDTRAEEAAAHKYAWQDGYYRSLSRWMLDNDGNLQGELTIPAQFGVIGGSVGIYIQSRIARRILSRNDVDNFHVGEFACIAGSAGLANNLAALWKIASEGIQAGHMRLFERQKNDLLR